MTSVQEIILLFTKYPLAGKSKTRLIPALGPLGAADLQRAMAYSITQELRRYADQHDCDFEVHHQGGTPEMMRQWLGRSLAFRKQHGGGLGQRMTHAIFPFLGRYESIILIGSDCPDIDTDILAHAFSILQDHDIVLGPAYDGGYYLIGVQGRLNEKQLLALFAGIAWGTKDVLNQTLAAIDTQKLSCQLVKKLHDIDTPEDLRYINYHSDTQ